VAVKFELYDNQGEGINSTGLYVSGAFPGTPATTLGGGVDLHSGDVFAVHMTYDGSTLAMTITDTTNPTQTFTTSWPIDIVGTVGGSSAYAGFTGATGGSVATQQILTWSYSTGKPPMVIAASSLVAGAVTSGPGVRTFNYPSFPNGTGAILDSTAVGDNVTFTVNVPTAGTYDVKIAYKEYAPRGILQTAVNGTNLGGPVDEFLASGDGYNTSDLGVLNFATVGNYSFKFTVVGHNAASSGYNLSFGAFTLTPQ
jgi:Legume lectin domain